MTAGAFPGDLPDDLPLCLKETVRFTQISGGKKMGLKGTIALSGPVPCGIPQRKAFLR